MMRNIPHFFISGIQLANATSPIPIIYGVIPILSEFFFFILSAKIHPKSKMQMLWEFYKIQEICHMIHTRISKIDKKKS